MNHEWHRSTIACCAFATACRSSSASVASYARSHSSSVNPAGGGLLPPPSPPCCFLNSSHETPARSPHHLTASTKSSPSLFSTNA